MTKTYRLIVDSPVQSACADLLTQLEQLRAVQGRTVLKRIVTTGMDATALRNANIADKPDYSVLIGDSVPVIYVTDSPDGHETRRLMACKLFATAGTAQFMADGTVVQLPIANGAFAAPFGAVSRIRFTNQSGSGVTDTTGLYRVKLQQILAWETLWSNYRIMLSLDDHLHFGRFTGDMYYINMGAALVNQTPAKLLEYLPELSTSSPDGTDGQWQKWHDAPVLIGASFSGGKEPQFPAGLYYAGATSDWRRILPKVAIAVFWGSYQFDYETDNNLPVAASMCPDTFMSIVDEDGLMPLASFWTGSPLGEASLALSQMPNRGLDMYLLDLIGGDCAMTLPADALALTNAIANGAPVTVQTTGTIDTSNLVTSVQLAALQSQVNAMQGQINTIMGGSVSPPPTGGSGTSPVAIVNGSFDLPALPAPTSSGGGYLYGPNLPGWTVSGGAFLARVGQPWTVPAGATAQALGLTAQSSCFQVLTGLTIGQLYTLTVKAIQRIYQSLGNQSVNVYIDSVLVGTLAPSALWQSYALPFSAKATSQTLKFVGVQTGETTVFITGIGIA